MRVPLAVAAVVLVTLPATAVAQTPLPVGETNGVRIVRERGALVVVFTPKAKKLWRRVAGRRVSVLCTEFLPDGSAGGGTTMRAPGAVARSAPETSRAEWTTAASPSSRVGIRAAANCSCQFR
jgi:hypothetical protein